MSDHSEPIDILIAGAGLSGMLAAARLRLANPSATIAIVEKNSFSNERLFPSLSASLFDFIGNTLNGFMTENLNPELLDFKQQDEFGVLIGSALSTMPLEAMVSKEGSYLFAGLAGKKDWDAVASLVFSEDPSVNTQIFSKVWPAKDKKNAGLITLEHLCRLAGICDFWSSSPSIIAARLSYMFQKRYVPNWNALFQALLSASQASLFAEEPIIESSYDGALWKVTTSKRTFLAKRLVACMPPWSLLGFIDRASLPIEVLNLALKSQPVSMVTIVEKLAAPCDLPDLISIPSEQVEVIHNKGESLCFQAIMDYETSLDAPAVGKAVRRLKRAKQKILKVHPEGFQTSIEKLSLHPVAWSQPYKAKFSFSLSKIKEHISFVGDVYGSKFHPEENVIESLLALAASSEV